MTAENINTTDILLIDNFNCKAKNITLKNFDESDAIFTICDFERNFSKNFLLVTSMSFFV